MPRNSNRNFDIAPRIGMTRIPSQGLKLLVDPTRQILGQPPREQLGDEIVTNGDFHDFTFDSDANTVALWKFDDVYHSNENTGKTVIQDLAGTHDLSIAGWTDYNDLLTDMKGTDPAYQGGKALNFPGVNEYLYIPAASAGDFNPGTGDFTVEAWCSVKIGSGANLVVTKKISKGYYLSIDPDYSGGIVQVHLNDGIASLYLNFTATEVTDEKMHHIVAVIDRGNSQVTVYIDGVSKGSQSISTLTGSVSDNSSSLYVSYGFSNYFKGKIAAIRYSNKARTAQEIKESYGRAKGWTWDGVGSISNNNFQQVVSGGGTITQTVSTSSSNLYKKEVTTDGTKSISYVNETNHVTSLGNGTHDNISIRPVLNANQIPNFVEDFSQGGAVYGDELVINGGFENYSNPSSQPDNWGIYNWGTNTYSESRVSGYKGDFAYRVDITNYTDGRAGIKQSLNISGKFIKLEFYARGTTTNNYLGDGLSFYINPNLTTSWQKFTYFGIPSANILYIGAGSLGWMEVDEISIKEVSNGNHGLTVGSLEADQPAHPAAFTFDGIDDYVDFGDVADVGTNDFIVWLWFKTSNDVTNTQFLFSKGQESSGTGYGYAAFIQSGLLKFRVSALVGSPVYYIDINTPISANQTYFGAFVVDRDGFAKIYLDTIEKVSTTNVNNNDIQSASPLHFGKASFATSYYLNGFIGIAGIYIFDGQNGAPSSLPSDVDNFIKRIYRATKKWYED